MTERTFPAQDAPPGAEGRHNPNVALAVILACQLLVGIDFTIVNIALPQMQSGLGFSATGLAWVFDSRSEEHTSELQSRQYLVCRPLLEKKNGRSVDPMSPTAPRERCPTRLPNPLRMSSPS